MPMFLRSMLVAAVLASLPTTAFAQRDAQRDGGLNALNECLVLSVAGMGTGSVQLTGTFTGTISFSVSNNGGDYTAVNLTPPNSTSAVTSATTTGHWSGSVASYRFFRACMTSYTSGTAGVILSAAATGGGGGGGASGGGDFDKATFNASFGTAGSEDAQVRTVQGIASMTPLFITPAAGDPYDATADGYKVHLVDATGATIPTSSGNVGTPDANTTRTVEAAVSVDDTFQSSDLDESEEEVDDTAGYVCGGWVFNTSGATVFLKFYNADADDVTVGTTAADFIYPIPGNATDDVSAQLVFPGGCLYFDTGITVSATTELGEDGSAAGPGANEVTLTLHLRP